MLFIEASAKTKDGVQCAFEELVQKVNATPELHPTILYQYYMLNFMQVIQTPGLWEVDAASQRGMSLSDRTAATQPWGCSGYCSMF